MAEGEEAREMERLEAPILLVVRRVGGVDRLDCAALAPICAQRQDGIVALQQLGTQAVTWLADCRP